MSDTPKDVFDVVLITVADRGVEPHTCWAIEKCHAKGLNFLWVVQSGDALIGRARSIACTVFMEGEYSPYMIFIDSDIVFEPEDVEKILGHLRNGYDLIGGCYVVRGAKQMAHYGFDGTLKLTGGIEKIRFLSTGFMGISRRLLRRMVEELPLTIVNEMDASRCYPFFESGARKGVNIGSRVVDLYISEDWDFCLKAEKLGVSCYLDTSVRVGHIRNEIWTVEHLLKQQRASVNSPSAQTP